VEAGAGEDGRSGEAGADEDGRSGCSDPRCSDPHGCSGLHGISALIRMGLLRGGGGGGGEAGAGEDGRSGEDSSRRGWDGCGRTRDAGCVRDRTCAIPLDAYTPYIISSTDIELVSQILYICRC
jgi:hypothetical protein